MYARLFYYAFNMAFCALETCAKYLLVSHDIIRTYKVISHMLLGEQGSKNRMDNNDIISPYGFSEMAVISIIFTVAVTAVTMVFLLVRLALYNLKHGPPAYERGLPLRTVR